jgi:hypothetical protein
MIKFILVLLTILPLAAHAACQNPAPKPLATEIPSGSSCPYSYSQTGTTCVPSSSTANYFFVVPSGVGCPMTYSQQGQLCISNTYSCYSYYSAGGGCPSGYAMSGPICISN